MDGKSFNIYNYRASDLVINDIEHEGFGYFYWKIDPWSLTLPYTMASMDTLSLNVIIGIPIDNMAGYLVTDTLDIYTDSGHQKVILKVDSDLLSSLPDNKDLSSISRIGPIMPNPFSSMTRISFILDNPLKASLIVYNLQGQQIRVLADGDFSSGKHEVVWERKDGSGADVKPGIYVVKLATPQGIDTRKLVVSY
jgi:hypothetical protein